MATTMTTLQDLTQAVVALTQAVVELRQCCGGGGEAAVGGGGGSGDEERWGQLSVVELRMLLRTLPIDRRSLPAPVEVLRRQVLEALRQLQTLAPQALLGR
jgi:hypothetical protein